MLLFLASVIEQLDLALEHIAKGDVHNARFGLMLTDNAAELVLHQIAKDKDAKLKVYHYLHEKYEHGANLEKALGKSFDAKLKFARIEGHANEQLVHTIRIMHEFRNEVYHVGIKHESILPHLARFYFDIACNFVAGFNPAGVGWVSNQRLPERAKKYFDREGLIPGDLDDFKRGCQSLADACGHSALETISALADHMDDVIADQNTCIDIVANGVWEGQQKTRDRAIVETQAWPFASSKEGRALAVKKGWQGNVLAWADWVADNHVFRYKADPIPSWNKQAKKLRSKKDPHAVLEHYQSFMSETADLRESLEETALQVDCAFR